MDKSLSVSMTLRMFLCKIVLSFWDILLFGFKALGKGVLLIYIFIMAVFGDG